MAWQQNSAGWWGEGEIKFFMDGDHEFPTINGTGTEDYFNGAYDFEVNGKYEEFTSPYSGLAQVIRPDGLYHSYNLAEFGKPDGIPIRRLHEMLEGQTAILGANVLSAEFQDWFAGLWHGQTLAYTVAALTVALTLGFRFFTPQNQRLDRPQPAPTEPDTPAKSGRPGDERKPGPVSP